MQLSFLLASSIFCFAAAKRERLHASQKRRAASPSVPSVRRYKLMPKLSKRIAKQEQSRSSRKVVAALQRQLKSRAILPSVLLATRFCVRPCFFLSSLRPKGAQHGSVLQSSGRAKLHLVLAAVGQKLKQLLFRSSASPIAKQEEFK